MLNQKHTLMHIVYLSLALLLSCSSAHAGYKATGLENLNPSLNEDVLFEIQDEDYKEIEPHGKPDPMVRGRVRNIKKHATDPHSYTYLIATYKVDAFGHETWKSTTQHKLKRKQRYQYFRVPLGGLEETDDYQAYHFKVLTSHGTLIAGPFVHDFKVKRGSSILNVTEGFPESKPDHDVGMTEEQLNSLMRYIAQRIVIKGQKKKQGLVSATKVLPNNTVEFLVPETEIVLNRYIKKKLNIGSDGVIATTGGSGLNVRGDFNAALTYAEGDLVLNDKSSFIATSAVPAGQTAPTRANINSVPVNAYWALVAAGSDNTSTTQTIDNTVTNNTVTYTGNGLPATTTLNNGEILSYLPGTVPLVTEQIELGSNGNTLNGVVSTINIDLLSTNGTKIIMSNSRVSAEAPYILNLDGNGAPASIENPHGNLVLFDDGGSPKVPDSSADAYTIPNHSYKFYWDTSSKKLRLTNIEDLPGDTSSFNEKTITLEFRSD